MASMAPSLKRSSRKDANVLPSASSTFWAIMILVGLLIAYCTSSARMGPEFPLVASASQTSITRRGEKPIVGQKTSEHDE